MTEFRIFYAWQSDRPAILCRSLIRNALLAAAEQLQADLAIDDAPRIKIDQDTEGEAGSPHVAETIFRKIRECDAFVADLTFTGKRADEQASPVPNPNVLIEYGYALGELKHERIIAVFNEEFGSCDDLPFDIKHRRWPITYLISGDGSDEQAQAARRSERKKLARTLAQAIKTIVQSEGKRTEDSGAAVANLKRYISDQQYRIQLADLIDAEVERVVELTSTEAYSAKNGAIPGTGSVTERVSVDTRRPVPRCWPWRPLGDIGQRGNIMPSGSAHLHVCIRPDRFQAMRSGWTCRNIQPCFCFTLLASVQSRPADSTCWAAWLTPQSQEKTTKMRWLP